MNTYRKEVSQRLGAGGATLRTKKGQWYDYTGWEMPADDTIEGYKARLVAPGLTQKFVSDYKLWWNILHSGIPEYCWHCPCSWGLKVHQIDMHAWLCCNISQRQSWGARWCMGSTNILFWGLQIATLFYQQQSWGAGGAWLNQHFSLQAFTVWSNYLSVRTGTQYLSHKNWIHTIKYTALCIIILHGHWMSWCT